jgi:hypothetical protein
MAPRAGVRAVEEAEISFSGMELKKPSILKQIDWL